MYDMYGKQGKQGKEVLLAQHIPLVKKIAHQLKAKLPPSVEVDDLVQAGMMGLLDAMQKYADDQGAQFETYASQRIRGAMIDELRSSDWLPRSVRQNAKKIEDAVLVLIQQLQRQPQEAEIAAYLNMSLNEYQSLLNDCGGIQLLFYEDFSGEDGEGADHFLDSQIDTSDADNPLQVLLDSGFNGALVDVIKALPERDQLLMSLYYDEELNLKEIGAVLGVSESRVSQLHSQTIIKIRTMLKQSDWMGEKGED